MNTNNVHHSSPSRSFIIDGNGCNDKPSTSMVPGVEGMKVGTTGRITKGNEDGDGSEEE